MTSPRISVIICTHNPRRDYFQRVLGALAKQTLPLSDWNLVVVDNASTPPVSSWVDSSFHPAARLVMEAEPGLIAARLRGISEASGDILVFVDDDNLLATDYLQNVKTLATEWPMLGVWGCGIFTPEWEQPPAESLKPYLSYLAVHEIKKDRWSNRLFDYEATPPGAGLCIRAQIAQSYSSHVSKDPRRHLLGRKKNSLAACEDFDLAFHAIDKGFGTGVFRCLRMTHLMPGQRVEESYLLRLVEGHACSSALLHAWRGSFTPPPSGILAQLRRWRYRRTLSLTERRIFDASLRGEKRARALLQA